MKSTRLMHKIKILRKQLGISQFAMAEKLGISQNAFSKIELGKSEMTLSRLYQVADILEVDLLDLIQIEEY